MSRDISIIVVGLLCVMGCGSVELAGADAAPRAAGVDGANAVFEVQASDLSPSDAQAAQARDVVEAPKDPLPLEQCAGLINPGPVVVQPCSDKCATCTGEMYRLVGCRFDGQHACVPDCSMCPST